MSNTPVTLDLSTYTPFGGATPSPAESLQGAVSYGVQQDPVKQARLLRLQQQLGIPPVVGQGNEEQLQRHADVNSINYPQFAAVNPRTTAWASDPDNAAVSGVDGMHQLAAMEQNAAAMRSATGVDGQPETGNLWSDVWSELKDDVTHPLETFFGADTPKVAAAKQASMAQFAQQTNDPFFKSVVATNQIAQKPLVSVSGTRTFQQILDPKSRNVFSRAMTGGTKSIEALSAPDNLELFASLPFAPEDASALISGVFSTQMTEGAASGGYDAIRAAYNGDYGDAAELGAGALVSAAFAAQSGKHALTDRLTTELATQQARGEGFGAPAGPSTFTQNLAQLVDMAGKSKLRERSQDKFQEALETITDGDQSLRIPVDQFNGYFKGQGMDPAAVAQDIGSTNHTEAVMSGGDVEVPMAGYLARLDPEHAKALLGDVVAPDRGLTPNQEQEQRDAAEQFVTGGGAEKLAADTAAADAETASTPEYQDVFEQLRQKYLDAGETPEVAETLATKDANAYSNLARSAGMKPSELLGLYNPKMVSGEAPGSVELNQSAIESPEFKRWFGESKVTDESGKPLPVYRGEEADFKGSHGHWYTSDAATASAYAEGLPAGEFRKGANVTPAYMAMENPLVHDAHGARYDSLRLDDEPQTTDTLAQVAKDRGHDGLVVKNVVDGSEKPVDVYHAFKPEQVKSSIGNRGTFDASDPNILHQPSEEGARGWFRVLPDGTYEIGKTRIGDLSTFVHEPAHAYLKILGDLAKREGASDVLKGDYEKVLNFLGAKDGEPFTREQQETWARANEQYLREGKAPSNSLKGAFQRFAIWLHSVYEKASNLGVELTPEIRDVFDRLYAAEEGVNKAENESGPKLFTSAEEAGWNDVQFKAYAEMNSMSIEQAKASILGMMNDAAVREKTEAWRTEEENVRAAMTETIDASQQYKAIRALRKGKLDDGTAVTINRDELVNQFGEDRVKDLQKQHPGMYRNEGGLDPETAAEMLGFNSAHDLVSDIETLPRRRAAIEQATREYMTAKHGDIRYDGTLNDQARVALENDKRAETLHGELKALKKKLADVKDQIAGQRQDMRAIDVAPIDAYRDAAQQMVEGKAVVDLQPTRYMDAARKYSREAFDALRKGDAYAAEQAKHRELLNHFLFREATKAKEYVGKVEIYAKRMQTRGVQEKLGLAGGDFRDQFNRVLGRYGLGPGVPAPERSLMEWSQAQYDEGKEPAIAPTILNEGRTVNYRNAPVAEIRLVHDALVNIRKLASLELGMEVNGRKIEFATAMQAMDARAHESLKTKPTRVLDQNATAGESATNYVQRGDALLARTEFLMKRLDGGVAGPWHDNLWNLASDAQGNEYKLQEEVTQRVGDALQAMPKEQRMRMLDKVNVEGIGETVTRKDLVSMAFNLGNDGNRERLEKTFAAHGWEPRAIDTIQGMLTREEWQFVQDGWDSLKPLGQAQSELERRMTGLPPVMVKPTPLHIELADGSTMDLEGGYYPVVMDPRFSARGATADAGATAQNLMEAGYGRATTSRGNMKERTGFGGAMQLDYEQVLTQHTAKVIKDITHREFMLVANKLLLDPQIRQTLRETLGTGYEEKMLPWLRTIINDRNGSAVQGLGDLSRLMGKLRTNLVKASLGFKASTMLLQLTHASSIFLHTSPGSYAQAMVDFLAHPSEMTEEIRNLSPNEMHNRGENIDRDMREVLKNGIGKRSFSKVVAKAGMFPVKMMDHVLSFPLWKAVYQDALKENLDLPESEAQRLAMHKADGAVRMGLGSNAPKDLPPVMRNNDFWKVVTTLGGFHNLKYNQIVDVGRDFGRNRSYSQLTYRLAMAAIIPAVVGAYVTGRRPKDDENTGEWAAKRALLFAPETVPLLGNVIDAAENHGDVRFSPLVNIAEKAGKAAYHAGEDKDDKDWTGIGMDAGEAAGEAFGVPGTEQVMKTLRYTRRAQAGNIANPNAWDAVVGAAHK